MTLRRGVGGVDRYGAAVSPCWGRTWLLERERIAPSNQGCHSPTLNAGVQKLSGQKKIETKY
jgi:hypothetical protein